MANGNIMMIPVPEEQSKYESKTEETGINITEQINSSGVWTSLVGNTSNKKAKNSERYCILQCKEL